MRWLIVGAGALGSILAANLTNSGEDVTLLARGARAKRLREHGLKLTGLAEMALPVNVVEDSTLIREADVLVLATKTYDTDAALEPLRRVKVTSAFSIQNGLRKDEQLAAIFGKSTVLGCAADFSGEVQPDGSVRYTRNAGLYVGELAGGSSERVRAITEALSKAGIWAEAREDIQSVEWSKLVGWLALAPLAALSRFDTARLLQDPDLAGLQWQLATEAAKITDKLGIPLLNLTTVSPALAMTTLTEEAWIEQSRQIGEAMAAAGRSTHKVSALQDLERGQRLELDETFGYALDKAHELGLELPRLETCYRLLSALDRGAK